MNEKQQIAADIKALVEQLRQHIGQAEDAGLTVELEYSSPKWSLKRELSVKIVETTTY